MARKHLTKRFEEKDIDKWKKKAIQENRNLSNWMETTLNKAADKVGVRNKNNGRNDDTY